MDRNNAGLSTSISSSGVDTSDLKPHYTSYSSKWEDGRADPANNDSSNEWYYKKHEAEMNHRYAIDMMEREYDLNNPLRVASLFREAGINPRSVFGNAASGSGMASSTTPGSASGSYGKSDATQRAQNTASIMGGLSQIADSGINLASSIGGLLGVAANNTFTNAKTQGVQIENTYKEQQIITSLTKERAEIERILEDTKLKEADRLFYEQRKKEIDQSIKESNQRIQESGQRINHSNQQIAQSQTEQKKIKADTRRIEAETRKTEEETSQLKEQRESILEGLIANNNLKGAQEEYYINLSDKITKDIALIEKDLENYDIRLGAELAQMTSEELRGWAQVVEKYLEMKNKNGNDDVANRISLLRVVLPFLIKLAK